ncbi:MAG: filamentous hemagglutinin N-terminal domain-containing protein [Pleurocapsa sp. MO_226.B13]|nr:filamentous hemagglutinin N-terminal domain-containing protein [Pleurocapsa sp. MO_226.B13]
MKSSITLPLTCCLVGSSLQFSPALAQVTSDGTVNTQVNQNGNVAEITGGETRGGNLFHSFQDFSVPTGNEAFFDNANNISNIFSRVTGGNVSNIDGLIRANNANLFLINPAGIIFGENGRLDIGGSFYGSSANSILFPDGVEFSATDTQPEPILTINAPIGLSFRDNPGEIVNRSVVTDDTGEDLIGLRVAADETLALLGGNVLIEGGVLTTEGGRIELGSVAENSNVSLTPIEQGFDLGYEDVASFQDISLFFGLVTTSSASTADIEVQGRNISFTENSQVGINPQFEGQAGDISINATESLTLDADDSLEVIFSRVSGDATAETSSINIDTPQLTITGGAQIGGTSDSGNVRGIDININASEITLQNSLLTGGFPAIGSQVYEYGTGDGGNITITTEKLSLNDGAQITTSTFGPGNGGDLIVNASESIELNGSIPDDEGDQPSALSAGVGIPFFPIPSAGNGGDITINTPRLVVTDGALIETTAQNNGNGGNLTLDVSDSILLAGTSPAAELGGEGRSGIFVNAEPSYEESIFDFDTEETTFTGEIIPTTGKGGNLTLNTGTLIIEQGALISADTFSLGNGGDANINVNRLILRDGGRINAGSLLGVEPLDTERGTGGNIDITATESVEITGSGAINGEPVNSSLFTLAESNGNAGNLSLTTGNLIVSDGGSINASAEDLGAAGTLEINANAIDLNNGSIEASTNAGDGGNITLKIADNLTLRNNSLISARAFEDASGGNVSINSQFIIAFPSRISGDGNDIIANANQGRGGNISITAKSVFGIQERTATPNNGTNDIDASSARGAEFSGTVSIDTSDTENIQGDRDLPENLIQTEQTEAQACRSDRLSASQNSFTINGKGGIPPLPTEPFDSSNIIINGEVANAAPVIPKPIETSQGKIQPAMGIEIAEDGSIILTAYRTDNSGDRLPRSSINCS